MGRGVCEKPKIKCADCLNRRLLPVTDEVIRWHLSGRDDRDRDFVMGFIHASRRDLPFLGGGFRSGKLAGGCRGFLETCRQLDLPVALERSRSGNGGHVWFFFEKPFRPASHANWVRTFLPRRWRIALRLASPRTTGFSPTGHVAERRVWEPHRVALQKQARQRGNSVFLDGQFNRIQTSGRFWRRCRGSAGASRSTGARRRIQGTDYRVRMAAADEDDDMPWTAPPSRRRKEPP